MSILHSRAQTISFNNLSELYEVIGYLCTPGRVLSIDAEVPMGLVNEFTRQYSGPYYQISDSITPSGLPGKFGAQFRINLLDITNAPLSIQPHLKVGLSSQIVSRINKSLFVEELVLNHGFTFGSTQNITLIMSRIPVTFMSDFTRGYNL